MIEIQKILCPVDLSEGSRHALDHALAIGRWYGSSVTVLHVFATLPAATYGAGVGYPGVVFTATDRAQALADLNHFVSREPANGVSSGIMTQEGDPVSEILAVSKVMKPDLIVLGTHGRSGFERLVLGSVTEKLLRRAECPVLSVPPRAPDVDPSAPITYKRILCPVDFSDSAMDALRYATSLAQEADAELTVLHVMEYGSREWPELYESFMSTDRLSVADFRKGCLEISRERLELAVPEEARRYCTADTVLTDGKPYREILRVMGERKSDLIVMGVRGRNPIDLTMFGSTTQQVVRLAACPVLTLRGA
jgi:nucleotide-binding universal stress UspA family protein